MSLLVPDFMLSLRDCCILDDFDIQDEGAPSMQDQINLPNSVVTLMAYVDNAGWTEEAELIVQLMMSSVHPDVESPVAATVFLPRSVRINVADFFSEILVEGISDEQRHAIFSWTQCWALASLDQ
jgi:hypothetical protein